MSIKSIFFALVFFLLGSLLLISQWTQLQRMPAKPVTVQLAQLKEKYDQGAAVWVNLEGGTWDCDSLLRHEADRASRTKILYRGGGKAEDGTAVYAEFSGLMTCEEIQRRYVIGTVSLMDSAMVESASRENTIIAQLPKETAFFHLCTFCSPTNSKWGVVAGSLFILVGLGLFFDTWRNYQSKRFYWALMRNPRKLK